MTERRLYLRRPYTTVALLQVAMLLPLVAAGSLGQLRGWPVFATWALGAGLAALVAAVIMTRMKWWRVCGFGRFTRYRLIWIFVAAIGIDVVYNWSGALSPLAASALVLTVTATACGAFVEETFYRGLMLRVLMPKGVWVAATVTAILFGLAHLLNAAAGLRAEVVIWQACYATAYGLAYAAFAIRTGTIWPIIVTHFVNNFAVLAVSGWAVQARDVSTTDMWLNSLYIAGFTAYGVVVIRGRRPTVTGDDTRDRLDDAIGVGPTHAGPPCQR